MTQTDNPKFLAAWKAAVNATGVVLYKVRSPSVDAAADKNDLRPDFDAIEQYIKDEPGSHFFLIAVLQFYSFKTIEDLCGEFDMLVPRLPHLSTLSVEQQNILNQLINSYDGW